MKKKSKKNESILSLIMMSTKMTTKMSAVMCPTYIPTPVVDWKQKMVDAISVNNKNVISYCLNHKKCDNLQECMIECIFKGKEGLFSVFMIKDTERKADFELLLFHAAAKNQQKIIQKIKSYYGSTSIIPILSGYAFSEDFKNYDATVIESKATPSEISRSLIGAFKGRKVKMMNHICTLTEIDWNDMVYDAIKYNFQEGIHKALEKGVDNWDELITYCRKNKKHALSCFFENMKPEVNDTAMEIFKTIRERKGNRQYENTKIIYDSCPAYYPFFDHINTCKSGILPQFFENTKLYKAERMIFCVYTETERVADCILIQVGDVFYAQFFCRKNETSFNLKEYLENNKKIWGGCFYPSVNLKKIN